MSKKLTRRQFVATTTAGSAILLAAPFVRTAHAAGKLSMGFWDHWVPGANDACAKMVHEWAEKEKVEVQVDFITSRASKNVMTAAAESLAGAGHDILAMADWLPRSYADQLEPMDDIMGPLIEQNGAANEAVKYLGRQDDHWIAVPATAGSQIKAPCSRIDLMKEFAGLDVQKMFPAGAAPDADNWTNDALLKAAAACQKGGKAIGIGVGQTADCVATAGAFFQSYGAQLVDADGNITVRSDEVRQVLEFYKELMSYMPPGVESWDDSTNNKWLISGDGSMIMNPPSAWAVAKTAAPEIAAKCWTHLMPKGPKGSFAAFQPYYWTVWKFSQNIPAAKSLLTYLSQPEAVKTFVAASGGYDLPGFANLTKLDTYLEEGPPKGTIFHYPDPYHWQTMSTVGYPAPANIAQQISKRATMTKMCVRYFEGEAIEDTLSWAESQCEGFMRG